MADRSAERDRPASVDGVRRGRDGLAAAHVLAVSGLTAQAVELALGAASGAAEQALMLLDRVPPADRAELVSDVLRHVIGGRGLDPAAGRALRALLNRHRLAEISPPPPAEATAALTDAAEVIDVVADWVATAERVRHERAAARRTP